MWLIPSYCFRNTRFYPEIQSPSFSQGYVSPSWKHSPPSGSWTIVTIIPSPNDDDKTKTHYTPAMNLALERPGLPLLCSADAGFESQRDEVMPWGSTLGNRTLVFKSPEPPEPASLPPCSVPPNTKYLALFALAYSRVQWPLLLAALGVFLKSVTYSVCHHWKLLPFNQTMYLLNIGSFKTFFRLPSPLKAPTMKFWCEPSYD